MEHEELTETIIGCAYRVYNKMGFGFVESVYENCLLIELRKAGLSAQAQCPIAVSYDGELVGEFVADIVVEDTVILELKSVEHVAPPHEVQLVNYLKATGTQVGLLLNFGPGKVEVKRKLRKLLHTCTLAVDPVNPVDPVILSESFLVLPKPTTHRRRAYARDERNQDP